MDASFHRPFWTQNELSYLRIITFNLLLSTVVIVATLTHTKPSRRQHIRNTSNLTSTTIINILLLLSVTSITSIIIYDQHHHYHHHRHTTFRRPWLGTDEAPAAHRYSNLKSEWWWKGRVGWWHKILLVMKLILLLLQSISTGIYQYCGV